MGTLRPCTGTLQQGSAALLRWRRLPSQLGRPLRRRRRHCCSFVRGWACCQLWEGVVLTLTVRGRAEGAACPWRRRRRKSRAQNPWQTMTDQTLGDSPWLLHNGSKTSSQKNLTFQAPSGSALQICVGKKEELCLFAFTNNLHIVIVVDTIFNQYKCLK